MPTWERICDLVMMMLGDRAADVILGSGANAGAENDLANATAILLNAIERQGLRGFLVHRPDGRIHRSEIRELVDVGTVTGRINLTDLKGAPKETQSTVGIAISSPSLGVEAI